MKTAAEIIQECSARGVTFEILEGQQLKCRAPKGAIDDELKGLIRTLKDEIIKALLSDPDFFNRQMQAVLLALDGVRFTDFPVATRDKARQIDAEMTEAANRGDKAGFLCLQNQWRRCFN
jgi:hypothetical protein